MTVATQNRRLREETRKALNRFLFKSHVFSSAYRFFVHAQEHAEKLDETSELRQALNDLDDELRDSGTESQYYFRSLLLVDLVSEVEIFFSSLIQIVVRNNPKKLGHMEFKLSKILDTPSIDELVARAAEEYVHQIMYRKPRDYLREICKFLSVDNELLSEAWPTYIEAKARRDLGVHNNWICNETYIRKLREADIENVFEAGQSTRDFDDYYAKHLNRTLIQMCEDLSKAVISKHFAA